MITARLREWMVRLWGTLGRRRGDADLEAELRSHQELAAADGRRGVAQAMDALRDQRGLPWIDDVARDVRHAARLLRRTPVFTGVAVLSLALGIGANSAIFSLADVLILRPLPVPDPSSILTVSTEGPEDDLSGPMSYPNYRDLRERTRSFDGLVAYKVLRVAVSRARDANREMRRGMLVSDNFFSVLGVQPALGRSFSPDEARVPGRDAVVVLSDDYWKNAFGADPAVLNSEVWMNGVAFHIVGIAPPGFTPTEPVFRPAFYVPVTMAVRLDDQSRETLMEKRDARAFDVKGRLAGASRQSARAELTTLWEGLAHQFPETNAHQNVVVRTELEYRIHSDPWDAITMALLFGLVALVLVIACANVANLMLGRVRVRSREIAVRLALGVSRGRLVRQLLTESLLLSLMGCAAGLAIAYGGIRFLQTIPSGDQVVIAPGLDHRVLIFSLIAAVASAAVFGLAPLRQSLATNLVPSLKASESNEHPRGRTLGRNTIVVAQVAMSLVLLVATAMFFDGFRKALVLDPGFRTDHLMMLSLDPSLVRYTPEQARNFYRDLVDRVQALPSVRSATLTSAVPFLVGDQGTEPVVPEGYQLQPGQESVQTSAAVVDDRYFDTMRINITRGRAFTPTDSASSRGVAVVNEEFARRYWPNQDPIGKRIRLFDHGSWLEVVGLTRTGKYTWIAEAPTPFMYLPLAQQPRTRMSLIVESTMADPGGLAAPLRDAVRALDVTQPIANVQTLSHLYEERAFKVPGIIMQTVGAICLLGLALALIGLYGLVAYSVSRRTREIGIRMAIGAATSDVLSMVLRQGLLLSLIGIGIGGAASVAVGHALSAALVGVGTPNPAIYVVVPIVLIGLTTAASYVPARRASLVDPLSALRDE